MDKNEITEASNYQAHFQKLYFTFISTVCSHKAITEKMENSYHHLLQASTFRGKKKNKTHAFHGEECIFFVSFRFSLDY